MTEKNKETDSQQPICTECGLQALPDDVWHIVRKHAVGIRSNLNLVNKEFYQLVGKDLKLRLQLESEIYMEQLRLIKPKDNMVAISASALQSIDDNIFHFTAAILQFNNLQLLDFDKNRLEPNNMLYFVENLKSLTNLKSLSLSGNKIGEYVNVLAPALGKLVNLQSLDLSYNHIGRNMNVFAPELGKLVNLQTLQLSCNQIGPHMVEFAQELGKLENLQTLHLSFNEIGPNMVHLVPALEKLTNLQTLSLSYNQDFKKMVLVPALEKLTNLQTLTLSYRGSSTDQNEFTEARKNFKNLQIRYLSNN